MNEHIFRMDEHISCTSEQSGVESGDPAKIGKKTQQNIPSSPL